MTDPRSVPARYARNLLEQAALAGCDTAGIAGEVGLPLEILERMESVPAIKYGELYQLVMRKTHDEWFGMFTGGKVPLGAFRIMCLTILQCSTLRQAILRAGEFADICRGMSVRYRLDEDDTLARVNIVPVYGLPEDEFRQLVASAKPSYILNAILTWHRFAEWLVDSDIPLREINVTFDQAEMEEPFVYTEIRDINFNRPLNGLAYDKAALDKPVVQNEENLFSFLRTAPYHLVTEDSRHVSLVDKVRSILKRDVSRSMPTADDVSGQLNMSATTLRRKLQAENTSYQRLKDECRMEAAFQLLNCRELSNYDIATKLGFDEPSAFFRSFKKWTGQTPGEYRARQQPGGDS